MYILWLLPLLLHRFELRHLVPNLGDMILSTPPRRRSMSGARVATGSSTSGRSANATQPLSRPGTKINKVWATAGYGQIVAPSRCKRIKRSFKRACRRAYFLGYIRYRGRDFWYSDIPFRMRQQLTQDLKAPSSKITLDHQLASFSDASNGLQYDEWLEWSHMSPYGMILLQEIGWRSAINRRLETGFWYTPQDTGRQSFAWSADAFSAQIDSHGLSCI